MKGEANGGRRNGLSGNVQAFPPIGVLGINRNGRDETNDSTVCMLFPRFTGKGAGFSEPFRRELLSKTLRMGLYEYHEKGDLF